MRHILRAAALTLALCVPAVASAQGVPPASNPAALAEARAVMTIMFPPEQRERTFTDLIARLGGQIRAAVPPAAVADPGLKTLIDDYAARVPERLMPIVTAHLPRILEATAQAYTREFTLEELKQIHAFAETPAGRHYLVQSTSTLADPAVAAANTAYVAEIQQLQASVQRGLAEEMVTYLDAHPEVTARLIEQNTAQ